MSDGLLVEQIRASRAYRTDRRECVVELDVFLRGLRLHLHVPVDQAIKLVEQVDDAIGEIKEPRDG